MKVAVRIAQAGNQILNIIVMGIILFLFLYGGYSLWDTYMSAKSAFLSDDLLSYKPQPGEGANPSLEDLMAINKDVAGWITIDDTHIDYPVVQGKDDMEYINKDVYGEFSLSGSIFLSCMNKIFPTIIIWYMDTTWQMGECSEMWYLSRKKVILTNIKQESCICQIKRCILICLPV